MMKSLVLTVLALCVSGTAFAQQTASSATSPVRRRPSMVGYIENATIGNKLRLRFDAGSGLDAPDRAEFFYAKCGCYRFLPAGNAAFDPDAPGPGPGVLASADYRLFTVYGEYAVTGRFSLVGELPVRSLKPQSFV